MDCSRDLTKRIPLKRAPVIFHWSLMCSVQGGYCHVSGSKAELTSYPISFTVAGFPVPRVFSQGHYVDFANVTKKDNNGFYATGAVNVNSWVAHDGWYIAIGW